MAHFSVRHQEIFFVSKPPALVKAHFANLETIAAHFGVIDHYEILAPDTLKVTLPPQKMRNTSFTGVYVSVYTQPSEAVLKWEDGEGANLNSRGEIHFLPKGAGTEVRYDQTVELEMPVPKLVAKMIGPMVKHKVKSGITGYIERMRASLQ